MILRACTVMLAILCGFAAVLGATASPSSDHWSFQPLPAHIEPPPQESGDRNGIDSFIRQRLHQAGLNLSVQADRVTLIRRLFLDMHGLPPTPEQVARFVNSHEPDAYERAVEEVLGSPRYGERWAQDWLDLVRYADTHGYEVNTPRPNAWPFRDYVINAFNSDKSYDRFVFEQLAGDSVGADAATGFLVASAVLLPGQIGADDASKRQARQDALDEMIVGTGGTFLALTIGCARCHNHKFDPLPQRDYYTMQAFFAGVEYGDRPINDDDARAKKKQANHLDEQIATLRAALAAFEPETFPGRTLLIDDEDAERVTLLKTKRGHGQNPAGTARGYRDDPGDTTRLPNLSGGRYTWWDNVPGEDVLSYQPGLEGQFRIWLSWGVQGSGAHTRDARYVLDLDGDLQTKTDQEEITVADQHHFAGAPKGDSEKQPLWSGLADAGPHRLRASSRIIVRGGQTGTAITADALLLQENKGHGDESTFSALPHLRAAVNPARNVERFHPVEARFIRFTVFATDNHDQYEPCLDELEVYQTGTGTNLALAQSGTKPSSSGNFVDPERHKLEHINDGRYGNERSWISNRKGGGWVQLELPAPARIDRVVWGRDREGKFKDRLAIRYRIEVALEPGQWKVVASSEDRPPYGTPGDEVDALARNVPAQLAEEARSSLIMLHAAEQERKELAEAQMVFAGTFREPDVTKVLNRGNPEQPGEQVGPSAPSLLGGLSLPPDVPEQARRVALAHWVARADNPLTARVMVNRIWQHHFGHGLVDTPSDFGSNGARPSHPQLLDWLAREFIASGWSIKYLQRLILGSAAYRQSSQINPQAQAIDGDCRLLWRFPSRRLPAESIRDSILWVNGRLNLKMGGPGFNFFKSRGGLDGFPPLEQFGPEELRRMIFAHKVRMERVPVFGAFDCPDAGQPLPRRLQSMTAIQALNLFNSPFMAEQAEALAARVHQEAGNDPAAQVRRAFQLVLGRDPTAREAAASETALREHPLATLSRVLYNSNEFLFLP